MRRAQDDRDYFLDHCVRICPDPAGLRRLKIKIHEYQAKDLLSGYGVPIPWGKVASTAQDARAICQELGGKAVIKAQVYAGGRGEAGGIRLVSSPQEAEEVASSLLGSSLVTAQTGPQGVPVRKVLVEEAAQIAQELYIGLAIDRSFQGPVIIASPCGGIEIEELAVRQPEKIFKEAIDLAIGFQPFKGRRLARFMGLKPKLIGPATQTMVSLYSLFIERDCSLVEINPLVITNDDSLLAVDAKVTLEDDSLFRHLELASLADPEQEEPLEAEASRHHISYVKLDGNVGCLVNGAGLAMATMDLVKGAGARPANFLDVGGSADEEKVAHALGIMLSDPNVKGILVNIFGGILRCDVAARGIVRACTGRRTQIPLVVRILGTNVEEGREILGRSGLNVTFARSLTEVVDKLKATLA